jgi:transposase
MSMGRKGKYAEWLEGDNLILLKGWARDGLTDEQISQNMGIALSTFYDWKKKFSDFSDALKKSKEVVDKEVENALHKSAKGFYVEETVEELRWDRDAGEYRMVVTKRTRKYIPPSNVAQIFWLKNRKPEVWKDKREIDTNTEALEKLDEIMDKMGGVE